MVKWDDLEGKLGCGELELDVVARVEDELLRVINKQLECLRGGSGQLMRDPRHVETVDLNGFQRH